MRLALFLLVLLLSGFYSKAQKIKYKDLYVLLRAKNYKDASGFLVKFLAENPTHPNANYQMGLMLGHKLNNLDLLKESDAIIARADSALLYFDKSYVLITPKDIKKYGDDYYELFKRRNLRTGKFEVILSDVQLDIENRRNTLEAKKANIILINNTINKASGFYNKARLSYVKLKEKYADELSLSLGADDSAIFVINTLIFQYDSALVHLKKHLELKKIFKTKNETVIIVNSIKNFSEQATVSPDFYAEKVEFNDFSEWGKNQIEQIKSKAELIPNLIQLDASLELIAERILKDSVDLRDEVSKKNTDPYLKELELIDSESLIYNLFQYKIGQLNLNSALVSWDKTYKDTLDVGVQVSFIKKLQKEMEEVKGAQQSFQNYDDALLTIRYKKFIAERYKTKEEVISYLNYQESITANQEKMVEALVVKISNKDTWGFYSKDSVSLSININPTLTYQTLYVDSIAHRKMGVVGLTNNADQSKVFFTTVPSSRVIDSIYYIDTQFKAASLPDNFSIQSVEANAKYYVYLIGDVFSNPQQMVLAYFSDRLGVSWHTIIALNPEIAPELVYEHGQIEIHQGNNVREFKLADGSEQKE